MVLVPGCLGSSITCFISTLQAQHVGERITFLLDDPTEISIVKVSFLLRVVLYPPFCDQGLSTRIDLFSMPRYALERSR